MNNIQLNEELILFEKYGLSPTELFVFRLLFLAQTESNEYLIRYLNIPEIKRGEFRNILISLQDKGIILKSYHVPNKGEKLDIYAIEFNKNFTNNFLKASFELGKELFDAYPQFTTINGVVVPLRTVAKKFDSLEDCYRFYGKQIRNNIELHNHIIELVKWAGDNNILHCSLASFIINNQWNDLDAIKNGDNVNFNFDAVKML